nr:MAG TPA: hypothetical protein [Caudoviricetes sp.]
MQFAFKPSLFCQFRHQRTCFCQNSFCIENIVIIHYIILKK